MNELENKLEALLFVSGDGVEISEIIDKWQVTDKQIEQAYENLKNRFNDEFGIKIIKFRNKLQLCSNPVFADDISNVLNPIRERNLSKATLETIAIIAYKQPITRLDIEQIRGVNSDYAIQTLLKHNLIEVVGRKDAIGKPLLFGTTDEFLKRFDLEDLNNLPNYDELINSIQVINQTTLYNEFDIPEEDNENLNEEQNEMVENSLEENIENYESKEISEEIKKEITIENDLNKPLEELTEEEIALLHKNANSNLESLIEN